MPGISGSNHAATQQPANWESMFEWFKTIETEMPAEQKTDWTGALKRRFISMFSTQLKATL